MIKTNKNNSLNISHLNYLQELAMTKFSKNNTLSNHTYYAIASE